MESILYNIIKEVKTKLSSLSMVDEDYGQLDNLDNESVDMYPLTFPAVLVDAPDVSWSQIEGQHQKGEAKIRVRLIVDCYDDHHYGSNTMDAILQRNELVTDLHHLLQGFRPDGGAPMNRVLSRFWTANHGIKVYESNYTVTVTDYVTPKRTGKPGVGINVVFNKPE